TQTSAAYTKATWSLLTAGARSIRVSGCSARAAAGASRQAAAKMVRVMAAPLARGSVSGAVQARGECQPVLERAKPAGGRGVKGDVARRDGKPSVIDCAKNAVDGLKN